MTTVTLTRHDHIALITIDNPPVNALSLDVRSGLLKAIAELNGDVDLSAAVIRCAGRTFIAGADITEFGRPPEAPFLPEVTNAIEQSAKPIVAALHGTALGGGFEIALAAHWRVALTSAKVGLPEVKLGVMPGAGGTQRLPRWIGMEHALHMVIGGDPIDARTALEWGAIDELVDDDLEGAALAAARTLITSPGLVRRSSELPIVAVSDEVWANANKLAASKRGQLAPLACIKALRAASELNFVDGLKQERELFLELRASPQAAALRHAFLGEREVSRVPNLPKDTPTRDIKQVAVIGAGTMGGGIAMCFANAGLPVTLLEAEQVALDRGVTNIQNNYAGAVKRGSLSEAKMQARMALIKPTLDWQQLATADLILEAVFEDFAVKRDVLGKMDAVAKPGAILATNTSYLDVAQLAACTNRSQDVIGLHFFSPANVMKLLEVVRTPNSAPDVQATAMQLGKTLNKVAVMVGGSDGFVGNRMLAQRTRETYFLLEEGALPEQVDRALVEFGFAMGPFAVGDLAGLDIGWRNRKSRAHLRKPGVRDCDLLDQVCELGRYGQKTGAGWYRYEAGNRKPLPDPLIEKLILDHSQRHQITRRVISDQEIVERCLYAMINEGFKILQEGVAARAVDIDMVWLHGYGFPTYRGGPMFYAAQTGLPVVLNAIRGYCERLGTDFWTPAALLEQYVAEGRDLYASTNA